MNQEDMLHSRLEEWLRISQRLQRDLEAERIDNIMPLLAKRAQIRDEIEKLDKGSFSAEPAQSLLQQAVALDRMLLEIMLRKRDEIQAALREINQSKYVDGPYMGYLGPNLTGCLLNKNT